MAVWGVYALGYALAYRLLRGRARSGLRVLAATLLGVVLTALVAALFVTVLAAP